MLRAVKSDRTIYGNDDNDSNPANNTQIGELWDKSRAVHAEVIEWLCKSAITYGRSASKGIRVYGTKVEGILDLSDADINPTRNHPRVTAA